MFGWLEGIIIPSSHLYLLAVGSRHPCFPRSFVLVHALNGSVRASFEEVFGGPEEFVLVKSWRYGDVKPFSNISDQKVAAFFPFIRFQ
jgi:hypothetical protein